VTVHFIDRQNESSSRSTRAPSPCIENGSALKLEWRGDTFAEFGFVEHEANGMAKALASKPHNARSQAADRNPLEDNFAETFKKCRGKVDPKVKLDL